MFLARKLIKTGATRCVLRIRCAEGKREAASRILGKVFDQRYQALRQGVRDAREQKFDTSGLFCVKGLVRLVARRRRPAEAR